MPLPVPSPSIIKSILVEWALSPAKRGYVSPSVFKIKGAAAKSVKYFDSHTKALNQLKFNRGAGGKVETSAGFIPFEKSAQHETIGINVQFYLAISDSKTVQIPYSIVKYIIENKIAAAILFGFYRTNGKGAFFAILENWMGIAATKVSSYSPDKVAAMERLYNEANLLKAEFNTLVAFATMLSKKELDLQGQKLFNQAMLRIQSMQAQMLQLKDVSIIFNKDGKISGIGIAPVVIVIIAAVIIAPKLLELIDRMNERSAQIKKIREENGVLKFVADSKNKNFQDYNKKIITKDQLDNLNKGLDEMAKTATGVITANAATPKATSLFGEVGTIVKWGIVGLLVFKGMDLVGKRGK
jgi:hypothetical protein